MFTLYITKFHYEICMCIWCIWLYSFPLPFPTLSYWSPFLFPTHPLDALSFVGFCSVFICLMARWVTSGLLTEAWVMHCLQEHCSEHITKESPSPSIRPLCVNPRGRWGIVTQSSAGKHSCPELEWPWHSWQPTFHTIHPPSPGSSCPSSMVFPDPWGKGWYWCLLYSWAFHYQLF